MENNLKESKYDKISYLSSCYTKPSIALYTIITGNYDNQVQYENPTKILSFVHDAYFVSENEEQLRTAKSKGWIPLRVKKTSTPKEYQRSLKILQNFHPDLSILNKYDVIIYHDGNNTIDNKKSLIKCIEMLNDYDMVCFDHPHRTKCLNEIDELVLRRLTTSKKANITKNIYNKSNFLDDVGLTETRVLIRKNNKCIENFVHDWYMFMKENDIWRDQMFFDFCRWKNEIRCLKLPNSQFPFRCNALHMDPNGIRSINYYKKDEINQNIQLDINVINDIVHEIRENEKCKVLVFGLGYDSQLWYNECKNTIFIEHDEKWIHLNSSIPKENIVHYAYNGINVRNSLENFDNIMFLESFILPNQLVNKKFDIILIDGPPGYNLDTPGRLLPLYWSFKYFGIKRKTKIYVADIKRSLEQNTVKYYYEYLHNAQFELFNQRDGCVKIYY